MSTKTTHASSSKKRKNRPGSAGDGGGDGEEKATLKLGGKVKGLKPVLASFTSTIPPSQTPFTLYSSPNSSSSHNDASGKSKSTDHGGGGPSILVGETPTIEYVSENQRRTGDGMELEDEIGEDKGYECQYFLAVRSRKSSTLTLHPAPLPVHLLSPFPKSHHTTNQPSSSHLDSNTSRELLASQFGSKRSIRAMKERERGRVRVGDVTAGEIGKKQRDDDDDDESEDEGGDGEAADKALIEALQSRLTSATKYIPDAPSEGPSSSRTDADGQSTDSHRPTPLPDLSASSKSQVYSLLGTDSEGALMTNEEWEGLGSGVRRILQKVERDGGIDSRGLPIRGNGSGVGWVMRKIEEIVNQNNDGEKEEEVETRTFSKESKNKLRILLYISSLMCLRNFRGGRGQASANVIVKEDLMKRFGAGSPSSGSGGKGWVGNSVIEGLLERFTESGEDERMRKTSFTNAKLMAYMFALMLMVDNYSVDVNDVAIELAMSIRTTTEIFKSLGCTMSLPSVSERKLIEARGGDMKAKRAVLKLPLKFPKPSRGGGARGGR